LSLELVNELTIESTKNDEILDHLRERRARGRPVVVLVDDAQLLNRSVWRRLADVFELDAEPLVRFVLVGSSDLVSHVEALGSRRLAPCIGAVFTVDRLTHAETLLYIDDVVTTPESPITAIAEDATAFLTAQCGGLIRLIDNTIQGATLIAQDERSTTLTLDIVTRAWARTFGSLVKRPTPDPKAPEPKASGAKAPDPGPHPSAAQEQELGVERAKPAFADGGTMATVRPIPHPAPLGHAANDDNTQATIVASDRPPASNAALSTGLPGPSIDEGHREPTPRSYAPLPADHLALSTAEAQLTPVDAQEAPAEVSGDTQSPRRTAAEKVAEALARSRAVGDTVTSPETVRVARRQLADRSRALLSAFGRQLTAIKARWPESLSGALAGALAGTVALFRRRRPNAPSNGGARERAGHIVGVARDASVHAFHNAQRMGQKLAERTGPTAKRLGHLARQGTEAARQRSHHWVPIAKRVGTTLLRIAKRPTIVVVRTAVDLWLHLKVWFASIIERARSRDAIYPEYETEFEEQTLKIDEPADRAPRLLIGLGFGLFAGPILIGLILVFFARPEPTNALARTDNRATPAIALPTVGGSPPEAEVDRVDGALANADPVQDPVAPIRTADASPSSAAAGTLDESDVVLAYLSERVRDHRGTRDAAPTKAGTVRPAIAESDAKPPIAEAERTDEVAMEASPAKMPTATLAELKALRADVEPPARERHAATPIAEVPSVTSSTGTTAEGVSRARPETLEAQAQSIAVLARLSDVAMSENQTSDAGAPWASDSSSPQLGLPSPPLDKALAVSGSLDREPGPVRDNPARPVGEHNPVEPDPSELPVAKTYPVVATPTAATAEPQPPMKTESIKRYRVESGDSLLGIAVRNGVTLDQLLGANQRVGVKKTLRIGEVLTIPDAPADRTPTVIDESSELKWYAVRRGDTLWEISQRLDIPVTTLRSLNGIEKNRIVVGQRLRLPPET
ncbi:MAG: LysM peptidoglycan-binding domain-containing protein, partial [Pseudomonadota bacterium]